MKRKIRNVTTYFANDDVPKDMLRYDTAFVASEKSNFVHFVSISGRHGALGGKPTFDRWKSFGIKLTLHNDRPVPESSWITYRHPRSTDGPTDYSKLVPVTLGQILEGEQV